MKKQIGLTIGLMAAATMLLVNVDLYAAESGGGHIKNVTAITEVFGDGQKVSAVAVEFDKAIDNAKLSKATFAVAGRTVTAVYANAEAKKVPAPVIQMGPPGGARALQGSNGCYAMIELSADDAGAALFDPFGQKTARPKIEISVTQTGDVATVDGMTYPANATAVKSAKVENLVVDDFRQFEFTDVKTGKTVKYNLFVPKNYDRTKSYPLVMFIHDGNAVSSDATTTLIQGLGAVIWASPSEQAKHECFVLAPQFDVLTANDDSEATSDLDATVNLIYSLETQYSIDRNRLYATGQSMGCMSSVAMNIKYPDLFAASMLVAGQWDATKAASLAKDKLWIIVSAGDLKAFPGMNAITATLEKEGTKVSREIWNGRASADEFEFDVRKMMAEGNSVNYTVLQKGTVVSAGMNDDGGSNHICTWRIAYTIEGVRDWLFMQKK